MRWGIVGTGTIARLFADALARVPGARLAAVASRDPDRAAPSARPSASPASPPTPPPWRRCPGSTSSTSRRRTTATRPTRWR